MQALAGKIVMALAVFCGSAIVPAEPVAPSHIILSSGIPGGGYWNAGARIKEVAMSELGLSVENRASRGSRDNLQKLLDMDSPVSLAFVQADVLQYHRNTAAEGVVNHLELVENIGEECVFIITGKESGIRDESDLEEAKNFRLGIASADSGIAFTFDYMSSRLAGLLNIAVRYGDTLSLTKQLNDLNASVDAVMTVHRPRELSAEVEYALSNQSDYRFVDLSGARLPQALWDGRKVYHPMQLAMPGAEEAVNTICVLGLLLANKYKLSLAQRNRVSELADYHWMKVYVTR
ncbi:MAG: hypothetical protein GY813_01260 [Halieaceae bacterium]|nr:hypothetical protein [Halieaceae bacterium]